MNITVVPPSPMPNNKYIIFKKNIVPVTRMRDDVKDQSYSLETNTETEVVEITAPTAIGAFYGVQSLLALISESRTVPHIFIKDAPRFPFRGFHLDVGRNFRTKEEVMRLLSLLATYKINKLNFHLTEDEGWRLEIKGLPELTEVSNCTYVIEIQKFT